MIVLQALSAIMLSFVTYFESVGQSRYRQLEDTMYSSRHVYPLGKYI